jgi:hypothetical protein
MSIVTEKKSVACTTSGVKAARSFSFDSARQKMSILSVVVFSLTWLVGLWSFDAQRQTLPWCCALALLAAVFAGRLRQQPAAVFTGGLTAG